MTHDEVRQRMMQGLVPDTIWEGATFYKRNARYEVEYHNKVVATGGTMKDVEIKYVQYRLGGVNV